ncbi:hypothetical protein D3C73_1010000 [compost metagenome]
MLLQILAGTAAHRVLHHVIVLTVQRKHRNTLLAGGQLQFITESRRISREGKYATEWSLPFQECGVKHHGATLGKTCQENSRGVYSAGSLRFDQFNDPIRRRFQLLAIDRARRAHGQYVVPARHLVATIDGDGTGRCLRENEARGQQVFLQRFGHRQEVVAVSAEAVEPDDAGICGLDGFKNQGLGHGCSNFVRALSLSARAEGASG